ncbi:MAG: GNAT family N-acetyltransferase [Colwellia sp.]
MSYSVSRVPWHVASPLLKDIREKVFVCERRIPKKVEFDIDDNNAFHMLVCDDISKQPIATGRISPNGEISRIAVLMEFRKDCVDKMIIQGLFEIAKELSLKEIYIASSLDKVNDFTKHNFYPVGTVYMEAGIAKQRMACSIQQATKSANNAKYYLNH